MKLPISITEQNNKNNKELNIVSYSNTQLTSLLEKNKTNNIIDLIAKSINNDDCIIIAEFLKNNTTTKTLLLGSNNIGNEGAIRIFKAIENNTTLERINLINNDIDNDGAMKIAEILYNNTDLALKNLSFISNNIESDIGEYIINLLKLNNINVEVAGVSDFCNTDKVKQQDSKHILKTVTKPEEEKKIEQKEDKKLVKVTIENFQSQNNVDAHDEVIKIAPNGNCFYVSVADQLEHLGRINNNTNKFYNAGQLRELSVENLSNLGNLDVTHFTNNKGQSFKNLQEYKVYHNQNGNWADQGTIESLALALNITINIHNNHLSQAQIVTVINKGQGQSINIRYTGDHYDSLVQSDIPKENSENKNIIKSQSNTHDVFKEDISIENAINKLKSINNFSVPDQKLIFLLGKTGTGKSTIMNILSNNKLICRKNEEGKYDINVDTNNNTFPIGSGINSTTTVDSINFLETNSVKYIDCPGLFDTSSKFEQLVNHYFIKKMLQSNIDIKILLTLSNSDIFGDNVNDINTTLTNIYKSISNSLDEDKCEEFFKESLLLVVTKVETASLKGVMNKFKKLIDNKDLGNEAKIILQLITEEKTVIFKRPTENDVDTSGNIFKSESVSLLKGAIEKAVNKTNYTNITNNSNKQVNIILSDQDNLTLKEILDYSYSKIDIVLKQLNQAVLDILPPVYNKDAYDYLKKYTYNDLKKNLKVIKCNIKKIKDDRLDNFAVALKNICEATKLQNTINFDKVCSDISFMKKIAPSYKNENSDKNSDIITEINSWLNKPSITFQDTTINIIGELISADELIKFLSKKDLSNYDEIKIVSNIFYFTENCQLKLPGKILNIAANVVKIEGKSSINLQGQSATSENNIYNGGDGGQFICKYNSLEGKASNLTIDVSGGNGADGADGSNGLISIDMQKKVLNRDKDTLIGAKKIKFSDKEGFLEKVIHVGKQALTFNGQILKVYEVEAKGGQGGKGGKGGKAGAVLFNNSTEVGCEIISGGGNKGKDGLTGISQYFSGEYISELVFMDARDIVGNHTDRTLADKFKDLGVNLVEVGLINMPGFLLKVGLGIAGIAIGGVAGAVMLPVGIAIGGVIIIAPIAIGSISAIASSGWKVSPQISIKTLKNGLDLTQDEIQKLEEVEMQNLISDLTQDEIQKLEEVEMQNLISDLTQDEIQKLEEVEMQNLISDLTQDEIQKLEEVEMQNLISDLTQDEIQKLEEVEMQNLISDLTQDEIQKLEEIEMQNLILYLIDGNERPIGKELELVGDIDIE
jgi:energy-coupling factor transporter ATP-binding protein EcfA2